MASPRTLAWVERLAWIFLYGGLFALVLGIATTNYHVAAAWSLMIVGGLFAIAGAVLIWVRARLPADR